MKLLEFIFSSFWTFIGFWILFGMALTTIIQMLKIILIYIDRNKAINKKRIPKTNPEIEHGIYR